MNLAIKKTIIGLSALSISALGSSAQAASINLVKNGGFENYTQNAPKAYYSNPSTVIGYGNGGALDQSVTVNDWSNPTLIAPNQPALNFLLLPNSSNQTSGPGVPGYSAFPLAGPYNGHNNGLTESPAGGNYIASDSDPTYSGPLQQVITGLIVGHTYELSFYEGAAQEATAQLNPVTRWYVGFGNQTFTSTLFNLPNQGFSGWQKQTTTFTATSTSQLLQFVALGGPSGAPPVSLLDGVSLVDTAPVPEPFTILGSAAALGLGAGFKSKIGKKAKSDKV
uniref:PEP-CTERM protein-sorting domain-containing protein n=2 Tax=Gloeothece TaxID=28070 RepID=E0UEK4_GLOV7|nr:conserved hypothetical protein [Gloeothece verrucosa PCC 7822]